MPKLADAVRARVTITSRIHRTPLVESHALGQTRRRRPRRLQERARHPPRVAELDNVFLLPHVGSATKETRDATEIRALDNLDAFFAGREPGDRVA